jgi:hypothetical protein
MASDRLRGSEGGPPEDAAGIPGEPLLKSRGSWSAPSDDDSTSYGHEPVHGSVGDNNAPAAESVDIAPGEHGPAQPATDPATTGDPEKGRTRVISPPMRPSLSSAMTGTSAPGTARAATYVEAETVPRDDAVEAATDTTVESDNAAVRVYGDRTTFGSAPWWDRRGWWKLASEDEGNDIRTHVGTFGELSVAATSLRGNGHRVRAEACEDSYSITTVGADEEPKFVVVAVTDGVGSSEYSSHGARLTAQFTVRFLANVVGKSPETFRTVIRDEQARFIAELTRAVQEFRPDEFGAPAKPRSQLSLRDMQCTLTFAIVPAGEPSSDGLSDALVGYVGDSPAFRLHAGAWLELQPTESRDGIWSTAIGQGALGASGLTFVDLPLLPGDGLLLSTDGVGNYLRHDGRHTALGNDLAAAWSHPVGLFDFVRDVAFEMASADDDRTAVMIWRRTGS